MPDLDLVLILARALVLADEPALRELEARGELERRPTLAACEVGRPA